MTEKLKQDINEYTGIPFLNEEIENLINIPILDMIYQRNYWKKLYNEVKGTPTKCLLEKYEDIEEKDIVSKCYLSNLTLENIQEFMEM